MKSAKKARRARVPLTRERVIEHAVRVADEGTIAAVSMRNVAKALGVEAMSLYNHVQNKDEILDGMVEAVVAEIERPTADGDWRDAMRARARSAHAALMRHPWAAMLLMSRMNVGPNMLGYVDATLGCLRAAGFSFALADHAWNALDSYIYGFTLQALNFPLEPDEYADVAESYMPQLPEAEYPHLYGMSQEVMAGRHDGLHTLEFGLELILDGLERLRAAQG